ncbi:MmcQ/YjbR family DNA-binding protein [Rhodococcus sp. NPDC058505]|uniref:MmcQ/YjbR family DNA-binding protein n=1 Tax=Rhodococcus sp. NPDC058505 TaxID=3346531 RepID=UPI0036489492
MSVTLDGFIAMLDTLPETEQVDAGNWTALKVCGKGYGYIWEKTRTVGLKATLDEQIALVAERPEVFEIQFTAGQFGWIVVHLEGIESDELLELVTEAWCLTAPKRLVDAHEFGSLYDE